MDQTTRYRLIVLAGPSGRSQGDSVSTWSALSCRCPPALLPARASHSYRSPSLELLQSLRCPLPALLQEEETTAAVLSPGRMLVTRLLPGCSLQLCPRFLAWQ
jgi:hypothetical protein